MTWEVLWQQWWVQVTAAVAGTLAAAWVLSSSKTFRGKLWPSVKRALRWPFTLRLTTSTKQTEQAEKFYALRRDSGLTAKRFQEVCDLVGIPRPLLSDSTAVPERIQRLKNAADEAHALADKKVAAAEARARRDMEATHAIARKEIADATRINEGRTELARTAGWQDGHAAAMAEVAAQRAVPLPKPVWRLWATGIGDYVELTNVQTDAEATDVHIEPVLSNSYAFSSPNQWPGEFERQEFKGERLSKLDISFKVRYRDAHGDWKQGDAVLAREPRKPVVARSVPRRAQDDIGTMRF